MSEPVTLLRLLGPVQIERAGQCFPPPLPPKSLAMLGYLARQARPVPRTNLAGLLWPDKLPEQGRANVRWSLNKLSQLLPGCFEATPKTIQFSAAPNVWLDTTVVERLLTRPDIASLTEAMSLYRGEFMADLSLDDCPELELWLIRERQGWQQQAIQVLERLADYHTQADQYAQAQQWAERLLELEPWHEETHRRLMRLLALSGQRSAALAQYRRCRQLLAEALDVEPMPETVALYEQIRTGELGRGAEGQPLREASLRDRGAEEQGSRGDAKRFSSAPLHPRTPAHDWGEAPDVTTFYGREAELAELTRWLVADRCRLVAVLGMGGIGKTALAAKAVKTLAEHFDFVFWRSLLNAPPLADILPASLQFLSDQTLPELPKSLDEGLGLLFDLLRRHRCLLVLDNVESILQSGLAGHYRPDYEAYGQLIRRMGETEHQSCLLLTSRERPHGMDRLEEDTFLVRSLRLAGLEEGASQEILQARGLTGGVAQAATALVQRYSGHPLALKLVSRTIQELFEGDITAFLRQETPIFDDIRDVLDQQFARLSALERELVIWLAIEREAISPQALQDNLVYSESRRTLLEALRALRRRSLLEKIGDGFTLQNVVMEYTTDYVIEQVCRELEAETQRLLDSSRGALRQAQDAAEEQGSRGDQISPPNLRTRAKPPVGAAPLLNSHALLKAQAKEYIRQSQVRLILQPIAERLVARLGPIELTRKFKRLLAHLQAEAPLAPGYAAGNILNLLLHLGLDVRGYDFSRLNVWQAYLRGVRLPEVNFTQADLSRSAFTDAFGWLWAIAYSPDGQLLAMATENGEIRLWQIAQGQLYGVCKGHSSRVSSIAFSPDGQTLASGSHDQTVRLWDVQTCQVRHILPGHADNIQALVFSPDGQTLVSGSHDQTIRLWDARTGYLRQILGGHTAWVSSLAFSPKGRFLASGSFDQTVRLWDVANVEALEAGQAFLSLTGHRDAVTSVAFTPDGQTLASSGADQTIHLWDVHIGQIRRSLAGHTNWIWSLAFSPDGQTLASGSADQTIRLWNPHTGQLQQRLLGHTDAVKSLAFSPDGETLTSASFDRTIRLWDVRTGQPHDILQGHAQAVFAVAFSPGPLTGHNPEEASGFGTDGQLLASGGYDGLISLWDSLTGQLYRILSGHTAAVVALAFSPDGHVLASGSVDQTIRLWDIPGGQALNTLRGHSQGVESLVFSPSGEILASSSEDGTIRIWDIEGGYTRHVLHGHTDWVWSIAFSPDGSTLASGSNDRTVRLWDINTGASLNILPEHTDRVRSVAFSPDGQTLASSSDDQTIRLWDLRQTGQTFRVLSTPALANSIAFSPDGQTLASGNGDQTLRLWDVSARQLCYTWPGHLQPVLSVAFSPDGQTLASGSADETVKLWDVGTGKCLKTFHSEGPYTGMNITGATGLTMAQKQALIALGAVEDK